MHWLIRALHRQRRESDLDKELRFHVDTRTDELIQEGINRSEARRRALAEFGGMEPARENTRDAWSTRWLEDIVQDVRYALRTLRAHKGFTLAAVLSLAVGIGANAAVFRVINSLVLHPLDVIHPEELFFLQSTLAGESRFSHPAYRQLAEAAPAATFAAMTPPTTVQVTMNGVAELRTAQLISGNLFSLLGINAQTGRLLGPMDESISDPQPVAVISDRYWTRQFGRAGNAVGSTVLLNNTPFTVVGIAQAGFTGTNVGLPVDFWLPLTMQFGMHYQSNASSDNADGSKAWVPQDGISWLALIGRVPSTISRESVLSALEGRYRQINEARLDGIQDPGRRARRLKDRIIMLDASRGLSTLRTQLAPALKVLMSMVALVLLVACANLANLLLARGTARGREFALRLSIGARRGRLVRQLLTESLTLAAIGGVAGLMLASWGATGLLRLVSTSSTPVPLALPMDWRVITFGIGATLMTGLMFGVVPAIRLTRPEMHDTLKTGGRVSNAARRGRLPLVKALVAIQVAVSLLLLVGAALFFRTFQNLVRIEAGFDRQSVVTARFDARLAGVDPANLPALYSRMLDAARAVPGVRSATIGVIGPLTGAARTSGVVIEGYNPQPDEDVEIHEDFVGPDYFSTLGMRLVAGRDFSERDDARAPRVAIINETMARRYFGETSPVGHGFGYGKTDEVQVIGVVADARANGLRRDPPVFAYFPLRQRPEEYARNVYVRSTGPVEPIFSALKEAMKTAAPGIAVREVVTLGELAERSVYAERLVSRLTAVFGLLGVAVACLGLYGTIAYSVARRTNEIGVRLALGASPSGVRRMILTETFALLTLGVLSGLGLVLALGGLASTQLYGLSPRDPITLSATSAVVIAVGLLAGAIPSWRASRVSPSIALRQDG